MSYQNEFNIIDVLSVLALIVGIYSFIIAIQNLDENRIQTEDTKQILHKLNDHLAEQDKHLAMQDELLLRKGDNYGRGS